jgi:hypothetical protein
MYTDTQAEFLLFECLQDLTGGDLVLLLGVNSLLVETTTLESRRRRMIMIDSFRFAGHSAGVQLRVAIKNSFGWVPVFLTNILLLFLNIIDIMF